MKPGAYCDLCFMMGPLSVTSHQQQCLLRCAYKYTRTHTCTQQLFNNSTDKSLMSSQAHMHRHATLWPERMSAAFSLQAAIHQGRRGEMTAILAPSLSFSFPHVMHCRGGRWTGVSKVGDWGAGVGGWGRGGSEATSLLGATVLETHAHVNKTHTHTRVWRGCK